MKCPSCGRDTSPDVRRCAHCGARLYELSQTGNPPQDSSGAGEDHTVDLPGEHEEHDHTVDLPGDGDEHDHTVDFDSPSVDDTAVDPKGPSGAGTPLEIGQRFGERYRIDALLGVGGMGAVYKAWDHELDIAVALKVIRPEMVADPEATQQMDRRFKRELLLARQVTHKNVVRIHDLGDVDGVKYISMSYIEGEDLSSILREREQIPVPEALQIIRSVVSGMLAAHEAGVVHRDLKPANIMIEEGTAECYVMDFGIARSDAPSGEEAVSGVRQAGMDNGKTHHHDTQAGGIVGTLQYMAPEQFFGKKVDQRADIYALGLIFYDMILGRRRITSAGSAMSEIRGRIENAPPPPLSLDETIPEAVDRIICRCLEPDLEARYTTTAELAADLARLDDEGIPLPVYRRLTGRMMAAAATMVVAMVAGTWWFASSRGPLEQPEPMSVLIADFVNETGDASFDGAVEQALTIAMEGAGFITAYSRPNAQQIAEQLQPGSRLDEAMARLVSQREGVSVILAGNIVRDGPRYALSVEALDPGIEGAEGKPLASARSTANDRDSVLAAVAKIAAELRGDLGDSTPKSDQLLAAETFSAASLEAMQAYARGQALAVQGLFEEALGAYQEAVASDPEFGRAYSGMGVVYGNLRRETEAEESYQKAFQHLDRMSERERYRTLGGYYLLVSRNYDKAIENYQNLVDKFPADGGAYSNLGYAYHMVREFDKAVEAGRRSVELDQGNVIKRINHAIYALYAGDFETAITESEIVLEQNPDFGYALFTMGRAAGAAGDMTAAHEAFVQLTANAGMGSSLAPMGHGDLALYRGRLDDAVRLLEPAISSSKNPFETASMLVALAEARLAMGDPERAAADASRAVELSEHESVRYMAARVLLATGRDEAADEIALELENRLQSQTTAFSGLIRAERALRDGQLGTALREIRWAREEYDFWFVHYLAGLTFMEAEQYPEAFDEFDHCVRRKGEATDVFLVDGASIRIYPPALYWLGRTQEALGSPDAARELYNQYLELRGETDPPDPLAEDIRDRIAAS